MMVISTENQKVQRITADEIKRILDGKWSYKNFDLYELCI
jgi:hypothetical protein